MIDAKFLTPAEVVARYREEISEGTLRNWRAMRIGPPFRIRIPRHAAHCSRLGLLEMRIPIRSHCAD
jgi:hypothetical protein